MSLPHAPEKAPAWRPQMWGRRGLAACLLWPFSLIYRFIVVLRRRFYQAGLLATTSLPVPVVIVGNLTVGGNGKTPLVIHLVQLLQARGYHPAIISRGYGGQVEGVAPVNANTPAGLVGDEPVLMARHTGVPVYVGRKRAAVAHCLLAAHPQINVLVSDDGLQHLALGRDLEIIVEDAARGYGNNWLLPAGPLREPPSRASEVDAVVVNGLAVSLPGKYSMQLYGDTFYNLANPTLTRAAADFQSRAGVHAVAGIGSPERFFAHLAALGIACTTHPRPDHHVFHVQELQALDASAILVTEKDAVKCEAFGLANVWVLPVHAVVDPALDDWLVSKIKELYGPPTD